MEKKNAWEKYPQGKKRDEVFQFAEEYRKFISACKTERECTASLYEKAKEAGFQDMDELIASGASVKAGDKIVANNMGKGLALFVMGEKGLQDGMNILGAHIDSPRLDLKQVPLYEDTQMAMLDTHYYGGVKKYQWVTLPMALHGVICKKDGTTVKVNIGDKPGDPVFGVSDLLIHLSADQMEKKAAKVIEGENLDLLIGSIPKTADNKEDEKEMKDRVKANILDILATEYGIEEDDFLSAEIEVVPAGEARDYGFDRSMIMGYGHDDRVCAYPSFEAILAVEKPQYTSVCLLVDKEEIGSVGASGMQSRFFENCVAEVLNLAGNYSELAVRRALRIPRYYLRMYRLHLIRTIHRLWRNAIAPFSEKAWYSINTQDPEAKADPTMPMQSMLRSFAILWIRMKSLSRPLNLVKWIRVAAERSPISLRITI